MSRTSYYDGESHEKRISKHRVSDDELFEYVSPSSPRLRLLTLRFKLRAPGSVSPPDDLAFEPRNGLISPNPFSFRLRPHFRPVHHRYLGYLIQPKTLAARYDPQAEAREREGERERQQPRISSLSSSIYSIGILFKDLRGSQERQVSEGSCQGVGTQASTYRYGKGSCVRRDPQPVILDDELT